MAQPALVNNVDHQDVRVITERAARYGDAVMFALTFPAEFRDAQAHYPILFHRADAASDYYPIALFGFQEGENLFLADAADGAGWNAHYVPAMIRRQPFMIGFQEAQTDGAQGMVRVLSMDMAHPRVSREQGEALFQPLGGRSEYLEDMADLLESIYVGREHGKGFCKELQERGLIEDVSFDITLNDGSRNQLLGFAALDEDKVQELSGEALEQFRVKGYLAPMYMMLASLGNVAALIERKNRSVDTPA